MKARLARTAKIAELFQAIGDNLKDYRKGDFETLRNDATSYLETSQELSGSNITEIACEQDDHREVENCVFLFQAMPGLSYYLARDERLWTYLVHTDLLQYARARWPIPKSDKEAIAHIRTHFFVVGARGFERDNAASRLWWMAALCSRCKELPLSESLRYFLHAYDVRANIIERPTTSQNPVVFSVLLRMLRRSYLGDKALYERATFRSVMKKLNLYGGTKLLDSLGEKEIERVLSGYI